MPPKVDLVNQRADEPFRLLVESVVDYAIFMLDPQGNVQTWNRGAERIKGYTASEIVGKHFSCFYPPEAIAIGWPAFELREATDKGRFEDEAWRLRKDGSKFWANVVITALYDDQRRLRGFAKVTRDLTQRRRAEALEASKQRMTEFLAMIAHELRNPLAPLRNATEILRARSDDVTTVQWAGNILERQVTQLTRLIDDLLDVSRVTSGKITLQKTPTDLNSIAQRAVESVRPTVEAREQHLICEMAPEPLMVDGDGVRLCQVAINLLNNAAKYTHNGGSIRCETAREGNQAALRVHDNGMGIPPDLLPHVFELFTQGERSLDRAEGGLGIGLALVERLVRLHNGAVEVHSGGRDQGAEFVVKLPLRIAQSEARGAKATESSRRMAASRVLIVDDDRDGADTAAALLRIWGNEVRVCYDGQVALSMAESFQPHVVLLDIGLPQLDGYEIARRLHVLPALSDAALIAMTGYGQEEDVRRILAAGFHHYFIKPLDTGALLDTLARLRPYPNEKDSNAIAPPMAAPPSTSLG